MQNITFNKYPGQNIKVRLTHFLPSGRYQLAMVPYKKDEHNVLQPMANPSCSCRLERLNLGKHALTVILGENSREAANKLSINEVSTDFTIKIRTFENQ